MMITRISRTRSTAPKMAAMIIPAMAPLERPEMGIGAGDDVVGDGGVVGRASNATVKAVNPFSMYS